MRKVAMKIVVSMTLAAAGAGAAFACGFLFFVMTILLALPGLGIILWEQVFGRPAPRSKGAMPERSG